MSVTTFSFELNLQSHLSDDNTHWYCAHEFHGSDNTLPSVVQLQLSPSGAAYNFLYLAWRGRCLNGIIQGNVIFQSHIPRTLLGVLLLPINALVLLP